MLDKNKIFTAGTWVILAFGFSQLIRLGSNLILTRLLEPELFGIMVVVHVVIYGISMFTDIGEWAFIVRHKDPEKPNFLDAVWTLQVIRGWIMFLLIILGVLFLIIGNIYWPSLFKGIYSNPQLPYLILIAGLGLLIHSYKSMANAMMHRKLEVGKLEAIEIVSQISGLAVMLSWAWFYPSIWALLISSIVSTSVSTFLSYKLFPFRHKLTWNKDVFKEVFHFSKWVILASSLTYLFSQADKLYFAAKINPTTLGIYSIAFMLVTVFNSVVTALSEKVIFPVFSLHAHGDRHLLKEKYYKVRFYFDIPLFFGAGLLIALSPLIINILYDERYIEASQMLQILALSIVGNALSTVSMECLYALSVTQVRMWVMLIRTIGLFVGLPLLYNYNGFYGAIWIVAINTFLSLPLTYYTLAKNSVFSLFKELRMLPFIGVGYIVGTVITNLAS